MGIERSGRRWTKADGENPPPKRPGRPPGSKITEKTRAVRLKLDEMLGTAHQNIMKALKKGDVPTSRWLIEHLTKEQGIRADKHLLQPLVEALETLDDVTEVSKRAVLMAIKGDMTFEQLKYVQEALARHSVLSGVIELKRLRDEVTTLMEANEIKPTALGRDHLPTWGRLAKDVTPTHVAEQSLPAE